MQTENYRPDIDGLRALAVLSVMFFHVGIGPFSGGYVGVDVFFVISGFLITRFIRDEVLRSGTFSFSNFYLRRARRLMPALFFTLATSFAAGFVLFSPHDLQRMGGALVHAVVSLSNFYFWSESGYFDAEASVKPLLHAWSLSIEEQFYLVWPACLVLLLTKARRFTVPALVIVGLLSMAMNLEFADGDVPVLAYLWPSTARWFEDGAATIYYLAPFRVFEFAIGAGCVWWVGRGVQRQWVAETFAIVGLALIVLAAVIYTRETVFPSVAALPPCLGTALLLRARSARVNSKFLSHRFLVKLGLISYSLYLVHWPLIVFYRYAVGHELDAIERWAIVGASIALASLMYRFVEQPFRYGAAPGRHWSPAGFGLGCALCALGLMTVAASSWATLGWTWRFGESRAIQAFGDIDEMRRAREVRLGMHMSAYFAGDHKTDEDKTRVLVVGDSLGDDLVLGLRANLGSAFDVQKDIYWPGCYVVFTNGASPTDPVCSEQRRALDMSMKIPAADWVFISYRSLPVFAREEFVPLVQYLQNNTRAGTPIVLLGRGPEFPGFQSTALSNLAAGASIDSVERAARQVTDDMTDHDRRMRIAAEELGIDFISKYDLICSDERCKYFTDDSGLMFWDRSHMSIDGANWYGAQVVSLLNARPYRSPLEVDDGRSSRPAMPATRPGDPRTVDAAGVLERYGALLSALSLDGNHVVDVSRLPYPKREINASILALLDDLNDPNQRAGMKTMLRGLAFFQSNVGENQRPLDATGPDQKTFRELFHAEMIEIERTLAERGY